MKNSLFGTDGIRGVVGQELFTPAPLERIGRALAQWAQQRIGATSRVLIASDTRASCPTVKEQLIKGLAHPGLTIIDTLVTPTPVAHWLVANANDAQWGIIISASHNPHRYNGIKVIAPNGTKLSAAEEQEITSIYYALPEEAKLYTPTITQRTDSQALYLRMLDSFFPSDFLHGTTVSLDCAHGASSDLGPAAFRHFGAQVHAYNATPNGTNINDGCGAVHPEGLQKAVVNDNANFGFAFDGDGDRVIVVNRIGDVKDGDDILALLAKHPRYVTEPAVVGTIVSNQGLAAHLAEHGKTLLRANVGDKHVHACMHENNLLVGGEPSGHIIVRDYLGTGDGIFTALRIAEGSLVAHNHLLESFTKYPLVTVNIPVTVKKDLTTEPFAGVIKEYEQKLPLGRLVIRYSGTEPLLRLVVEDRDAAHAHDLAKQLGTTLQRMLL
jgi:phosphoglucosamine mutase